MAKIYINPGHGRPDPGAVGPSGLTEESVAALVGDRVAHYLKVAGHEVRLWQNDNLGGVIRDANAWGADLFLSIHCNSFGVSSANGTETLYHQDSQPSQRLALCIQTQMIGEFGLTNRGIKTMESTGRELGVLSQTYMPSCLAEMAFISNPTEEQLLAHEYDRWGACLARGVTDACLALGL